MNSGDQESSVHTKRAASAPLFPAWAWVAAALLALITAYTIRQMGSQSTQLAQLHKQMNLAMKQNQALQDELEMSRMVSQVMLSPESKGIKLLPVDTSMPMVHAYLHPHMGLAITADAMPPVPPARTLQLWMMAKTGKPMSVAIFRPDKMGEIALVAPAPMPLDEITSLVVTEEPAGGSPAPTGAPAWTAEIH